ncbi:hypothetical protein SASPL_122655 [Salvia splendens]|uniref:TMEM205-like domain-containing protein n=1 Tax=Salvia splendens TaxID=180675 RepID=A0A8X8XLS6_SALSN|nr:hypothetical protein SASPL_122655 [Salvia splendens]
MAWLTRFLTAVAFFAIGVVFSPETFGSKSDGQHSQLLLSSLKLAHLLCFSTAWGAALWVTFIGGIIMFNNMHSLGICLGISLETYRARCFQHTFPWWECAVLCSGSRVFWKTSGSTEKYQLGFLLASFAFNLSNLVIFTPMTIEVQTISFYNCLQSVQELHLLDLIDLLCFVILFVSNDETKAQDRERSKYLGGSWVDEEPRSCEEKSEACSDEQEIRDDPWDCLSSLANIFSFGSHALHSWYLAGKLNL